MAPYFLEIFVAALGVILLMAEAFAPRQNKAWITHVSIGGLIAALVGLFFICPTCVPDELARFYTVDGTAPFYKGIILVCGIFVLLMTLDTRKLIEKFTDNAGSSAGTGEFCPLILIATAGMMSMVSAIDLIWVFVSLELVTITFYILVAYLRRNVGSLEAGVKYLILGALSTGVLVYGIAWTYGMTGSTQFSIITDKLGAMEAANAGTLFALALLVLAIGFKVGAAPMQLWIPDVYQGAPTPITTFLSVGSKAAGFAVGVGILTPFLMAEATQGAAVLILTVMACLTLIVGNLAAIGQTNFKRLLAYSSIAHAGFILLALVGWTTGTESLESSANVIAFYLATYLIMTVGAFFVLTAVRNADDSEEISTYRGLAKRSPILALCLTLFVSAMAGLPLTAGFWGKFYSFQLAISAGQWAPVIVGFIAVAAGFYYYLKVVAAMYWQAPAKEDTIPVSATAKVSLGLLAAATLVIGVYPKLILQLLP